MWHRQEITRPSQYLIDSGALPNTCGCTRSAANGAKALDWVYQLRMSHSLKVWEQVFVTQENERKPYSWCGFYHCIACGWRERQLLVSVNARNARTSGLSSSVCPLVFDNFYALQPMTAQYAKHSNIGQSTGKFSRASKDSIFQKKEPFYPMTAMNLAKWL